MSSRAKFFVPGRFEFITKLALMYLIAGYVRADICRAVTAIDQQQKEEVIHSVVFRKKMKK